MKGLSLRGEFISIKPLNSKSPSVLFRNLNGSIIITFNYSFECRLYYDFKCNYSLGLMREKVEFEKFIVRLFREIVLSYEK